MSDINEFIYHEEPSLYEGWICMYKPSDGKIIWRDYIVDHLNITEEMKEGIKQKLDKKYGN